LGVPIYLAYDPKVTFGECSNGILAESGMAALGRKQRQS
jgi:hypothetical protein